MEIPSKIRTSMTVLRSPARTLSTLLCVALVAALVTTVGPASAAGPASAPDARLASSATTPMVGKACAPNTGVTVVVDFTALADVIEVGCALGVQADGLTALRNAGFGVNVDSGAYPSTVCTLDGVPTQGYPYCWTGGGTWAYWTSNGTTEWSYAVAGAAGVGALPIGRVQGWSWTQGLANAHMAPRLAVADLSEHDDPDAGDAAIAWTKRELADSRWRMPGFTAGSIDVGLTLDALLALAADGRSSTPAAARVTEVVEANTTNYVSWAPDHPGVTVVGSMAKVLLAAAIQDADVHDFAGWDLQAEVRSMMQTTGPDTGRFSDHDTELDTDASNGFSQPLAVLALARTDDGVPDRAVEYLLAQQCPNGGFRISYVAGSSCTTNQDADNDATAMAIQALLAVERTPVVTAAISTSAAWLLARQDRVTGGFRGSGSATGLNTNSTGLAAQALHAIGQNGAATKAAAWISTLQPKLSTAGGATADLGAIAYDMGAFDSATASGLAGNQRDQWRRATTQALLAFDRPALGSIGLAATVLPVTPVGPGHFRDVSASHPFGGDITWLVASGIATGFGDGTFRPVDHVTRQANAAFLYRLAGSPVFSPPSTPSFKDVPTTNAFYREIEWMKAERLTTGFADGTFKPTGTVQRQAVAAFLYRAAGSPGVAVGAPSFADVPPGHLFYDAITWAAANGITTGFADNTFRPSPPVARQAVAAFIARFALLD